VRARESTTVCPPHPTLLCPRRRVLVATPLHSSSTLLMPAPVNHRSTRTQLCSPRCLLPLRWRTRRQTGSSSAHPPRKVAPWPMASTSMAPSFAEVVKGKGKGPQDPDVSSSRGRRMVPPCMVALHSWQMRVTPVGLAHPRVVQAMGGSWLPTVTPWYYCSSYSTSTVTPTFFIQCWLQYRPNSMKMVFSTNGVGSF
jgi:hypothetical protein